MISSRRRRYTASRSGRPSEISRERGAGTASPLASVMIVPARVRGAAGGPACGAERSRPYLYTWLDTVRTACVTQVSILRSPGPNRDRQVRPTVSATVCIVEVTLRGGARPFFMIEVSCGLHRDARFRGSFAVAEG